MDTVGQMDEEFGKIGQKDEDAYDQARWAEGVKVMPLR